MEDRIFTKRENLTFFLNMANRDVLKNELALTQIEEDINEYGEDKKMAAMSKIAEYRFEISQIKRHIARIKKLLNTA